MKRAFFAAVAASLTFSAGLTALGAEARRGEPGRDRSSCRGDIREIAEGDALFRAGRHAEAQAKFESALAKEHRPRSDAETAGCLMNQIGLALQYQSRL